MRIKICISGQFEDIIKKDIKTRPAGRPIERKRINKK